MKSIISKAMMLVAIAAALVSFSPGFPQGSGNGGEGFEISLNGKVLLQQYGKDMNTLKNLQLNAGSANDKLVILYYHCGRPGKNRIVIIKDSHDKVVKEWHYGDAADAMTGVSCSVKEIVSLKKANDNVFKLYYSSTELPGGRMLASVTIGNSDVVSRK